MPDSNLCPRCGAEICSESPVEPPNESAQDVAREWDQIFKTVPPSRSDANDGALSPHHPIRSTSMVDLLPEASGTVDTALTAGPVEPTYSGGLLGLDLAEAEPRPRDPSWIMPVGDGLSHALHATVLRDPRDGRPAGSLSFSGEFPALHSLEGGHRAPGSRTRSAWPIALLCSYASAMTLACGWLLLGGGHSRLVRLTPIESQPAVTGLSPDREAFRVEPPDELPPERRLELGQSLQVGPIALTPRAVRSRAVRLERRRIDGSIEEKLGGTEALWLEIDVKNLSKDLVFSPIDEELVREPDHALPASYVQAPDGERIYIYPLPIQSEWRILRQNFRPIKPGESARLLVVSDVNAVQRLRGPLSWRVAFRSEPGKVEEIEVVFHSDQIQLPVESSARRGRARKAESAKVSADRPTPLPG